MLVMTDTAAMVIREIVHGHAPTSGLRISRNSADGALDVAVTTEPAAGDHVIEQDGAAVFVAEDTRAPLTGKALDASVDPQDGTVTFLVTERPPAAGTR